MPKLMKMWEQWKLVSIYLKNLTITLPDQQISNEYLQDSVSYLIPCFLISE